MIRDFASVVIGLAGFILVCACVPLTPRLLVEPLPQNTYKEPSMVTKSLEIELNDDELALYFGTDGGVSVAELGQFFQRMATVVGRKGVTLRVEVAYDGSLIIVLKAAMKEFGKAPIATASSLVSMTAVAITTAMALDRASVSPLTRAGIALIEQGGVTSIEIVTKTTQTVLLNSEGVSEIHARETDAKENIASFPEQRTLEAKPEVRFPENLGGNGRNGLFSGEVIEIDGEPYFRPDGHNYFIPAYTSSNQLKTGLAPGRYLRIFGEVNFVEGQPESISISNALPEQGS